MEGRNGTRSMQEQAAAVVREILGDYGKRRAIDRIENATEPSRDVIVHILHELFQIVYPGYYRDPDSSRRVYNVNASISTIVDDIIINLQEQIEQALFYTDEFHAKSGEEIRKESERIVIEFMTEIRPLIPRARLFSAIPAFMPSRYSAWRMSCIF